MATSWLKFDLKMVERQPFVEMLHKNADFELSFLVFDLPRTLILIRHSIEMKNDVYTKPLADLSYFSMRGCRAVVKSLLKLSDSSDEELLDRYAQGEPSAFEEFFFRHRGRVYQYALKRVNQSELAAEICQDVFLKLHSKIHHYKKNSPALPWFFTIVHNTCLDSLRKRLREDSLRKSLTSDTIKIDYLAAKSDITDNDPIRSSSFEESDLYSQVVGHLSAEQRTVLEGRVVEDKSFSTLSQQMGKTETALRKIYSRSIQKLRSMIENREREDDK